MKLFSIVGWSGSGKTTLITTLIEAFKLKGLRIITAKKVPRKYHLEPESKDSFKFLEAGSDEVFLIAKSQIMNIKKLHQEDEILPILKDKSNQCDIILLEGVYHKDVPKIEVFDTQNNSSLKFPLNQLAAIVTDENLNLSIPCFKKQEIEKIVQFMEDYNG